MINFPFIKTILKMRLLNRNCYRKIGLIFWFLLNVFSVLMIHNQLSYQYNSDNNNLINSTNKFSSDSRLHFPSLSEYLPYISDEESAMMPSYVLSRRPVNKRASIVFGVPHIQRSKESYLQQTLYFLIKNLRPQDFNEILIIVSIAETDMNYVTNTTQMIEHYFKDHIDSGILTVISPSKSYYPDFEKLYLKQTLGDPLKRVHWRTKQNLDFAYLMMYSYSKGDYYMQLEDDVISSPDYVANIKQFITNLTTNKKDWFTIEFSRLGFIGKLFKSKDLPQLISFLLIFHADQPCDWLLEYFIRVKICPINVKDCKNRRDILWVSYHTSLFQHMGYHSSLDGKIQTLKDRLYKSEYLYFAHKDNPSAEVKTSLTVYKDHTITKAYKGLDFFWSMDPKTDDNITFTFTPEVLLKGVLFQSGNIDHMADKVEDMTTIEILPLKPSHIQNLNQTSDRYYIIGSFEDGFAKIDGLIVFGLIKELRITFHNNSKFWLILSEIQIKTAKEE